MISSSRTAHGRDLALGKFQRDKPARGRFRTPDCGRLQRGVPDFPFGQRDGCVASRPTCPTVDGKTPPTCSVAELRGRVSCGCEIAAFFFLVAASTLGRCTVFKHFPGVCGMPQNWCVESKKQIG